MSSREGFDSYQLYLAIKLHFNSKDYDFVQYNGKVKADLNAFMKRKDKYHFGKLSRLYKDELQDFYVANLSQKDMWVGDLLENEAKKTYIEWKKRRQSLLYIFENEIINMLKKKNIREVLTVYSGQHPFLLKQYMGKNVSIETMCILDEITNYSGRWNELITETIIYPDVWTRIQKYKTFVSFDQKKFKDKLMQICYT